MFCGLYWKVCSVVAPWLSEKSAGAGYGVFCDLCGVENDEDGILRSIREGQEGE